LRVAIEDELQQRRRGRDQYYRGKEQRQTQTSKPPPPQTNIVDIRSVIQTWWRELVLEHHPDRGGDLKVMQAMNNAHERLKQLARI
jgi:hypothetical protein